MKKPRPMVDGAVRYELPMQLRRARPRARDKAGLARKTACDEWHGVHALLLAQAVTIVGVKLITPSITEL